MAGLIHPWISVCRTQGQLFLDMTLVLTLILQRLNARLAVHDACGMRHDD